MNILATITGSGCSLCEEKSGQLNGTPFCAENTARITLRDAIRKYWGAENVFLVCDREFNSGFYRVHTYSSANGAGWGYQLERVMTSEEECAAHDRAVEQAIAKQPVTAKSGLQMVFENEPRL